MNPNADARAAANRRLAWLLVVVALGFLGFGFALVPLYNTFCELTGLNGKTGAAVSAPAPGAAAAGAGRWVTVEFTDTVMPGLPWRVRPRPARLRVHPGVLARATYVARNIGDRAFYGQAVMSVTPEVAARHFRKVECFCFTRHRLAPGAARSLVVRFFVSPDLPASVRTITLSYAFFPAVKQH